jgi:hypothetical protein
MHPAPRRFDILPYWQGMHWALKLTIIFTVACIALAVAAIAAPWASTLETTEIVFSSVIGGFAILFGIGGAVGQVEGSMRYDVAVERARAVRGLPQHGSRYEIVASGEYVEIWEGNRAQASHYSDAWRCIEKFHAEREVDAAMEYWNNLSSAKGASVVATSEALALKNTLTRK